MTGRYVLGPEHGRLLLRTYRQGVAAQVGHDLVLELTTWSAELLVPEGGPAGATVTASAELDSLVVREGTGGVKPLTDRDRREIAANAAKALNASQYPSAEFHTTQSVPTEDGGHLDGVLTVHGVSQPLRLVVTELGDDQYRITGSVVQTAHGVTPYRAFLGALRLRDAVDLELELRLPPPEAAG